MEQIKGLSNINTVVSYVLMDMGAEDKYDQWGEKIAQLAIRGFIDMNVNYSPLSIKVIRARLDNNRRITLPNDYVEYTKVGINIGGTIWTLTLNPNMALDRAQCCNLDIKQVAQGGISPSYDLNNFLFAPHYFKGNYVGGLYGVGGGWNEAYFRIDQEYRQIQFEGFFRQNCEVILEYKSTGINFDTETVIPRQYVEPLTAYCIWKLSLNTGRAITNYDKEKAEQMYIHEMEKLTMFNTAVTLDEIMDTLYENYTQTPKR